MIQKSFDAIDKSDIDTLISNEVRESRTIDYKKELPGKTDDDKKELLADISSFANAGGGDLVFGIEEEEGIPQRVEGVSGEFEAEILRIENIIRDGLQPRVPGIRIKSIEGFSKGSVLLIRIPKSWNAPHMVTFKNASRFFARTTMGKYPMDVSEIRNAFLQSQELPERMRRFRDERLSKIISNDTPISLSGKSRLILHILPIASFASEINIEMKYIEKHIQKLHPVLVTYANNWRYNLDGILINIANITENQSKAYCQIFRSGCIETVSSDITSILQEVNYISSESYERSIIQTIKDHLDALVELEILFPIVIFLGFTGMNGVMMGVNQSGFYFNQGKPIDRDIIILPEMFLEEKTIVQSENEIAKKMRPVFDALWNACGYSHSFNYEANGEWKLLRK